MKEFLNQSVFFGVAISVLTYELGVFLKKKLKWPICNPRGSKISELSSDAGNGLSGDPALRAGGAFEKTFQGNRAWIDLRCDYESCVCACTGTVVSF